jgi:hypothetical protein
MHGVDSSTSKIKFPKPSSSFYRKRKFLQGMRKEGNGRRRREEGAMWEKEEGAMWEKGGGW